MREIEIKAHASDYRSVLDKIVKIAGNGSPVDKRDHYFRIEGNEKPSLRIRKFNDHLEFTAKKNSKGAGSEDNLEYEIVLGIDQYDNAVSFFRALGYIDYFVKLKKGYEWTYNGTHVELLEVNDLGWFLEMEILLPFDSSEEMIENAQKTLHELLHLFSLKDEDIEMKSYRSMILGR